MPWIVKLDKEEDFIGRWALEHGPGARGREQAGRLHDRQRRGADTRAPRWSATGTSRSAASPPRASRPSSRRTIGMAWVPAALAEDGTRDHARRRRPAADRTGADDSLLRPRPGAAARMSFEFLAPDAAAAGQRDGDLRAAQPDRVGPPRPGARTSTDRAGWRVGDRLREPRGRAAPRCRESVGVADLSFLGKLELQAEPGDRRRRSSPSSPAAARSHRGRQGCHEEVWWCPITPSRVLAVSPPERTAERARRSSRPPPLPLRFASVVELTSAYGSNAVAGPLARETFARTTALDLRPQPLRGRRLRAGLGGADARDGAAASEPDLYLHLFGAGFADYVWTVVRRRGGAPRAGARSAPTPWRHGAAPGRASMRDLFRKRRMWRPRRRAQATLRRRHHRRRLQGLATAYYLAEHGITDVAVLEKSYIGSGQRAATPRSCARTTARPRARASTKPRSISTTTSPRSSTST